MHSTSHPDLDLAKSRQISTANEVFMKKYRSKQAEFQVQQALKSSKRKRVSKSNVLDIIKSCGIRGETGILAFAYKRVDDPLGDLKTFIADTLERVYWELISKTWKLGEA